MQSPFWSPSRFRSGSKNFLRIFWTYRQHCSQTRTWSTSLCRWHTVEIFFSIKSDISAPVQKVEACISEIRSWMRKNKLKLNDDKTEYMVISSDRVKAGLCIPDLLIGATKLKPSNTVRNLGAMFDDALKMTNQISAITKRSHCHLRNIRSIRKSLTKTATEQLIHAFITSTLDNCNALLCGLPSNLIGRLQRIQNMAARVVALKSKYDSIASLDWPALVACKQQDRIQDSGTGLESIEWHRTIIH